MTDRPPDQFAAAAGRLYGLPPQDFIGERDALVKAARAATDRELADRVKALRRPTTAAHLLNLLARQHPAELAAVIDMGSSLRTAQDQRDRDEVRELNRRQHVLVAAVMKLVRALAAEHRQSAGDAVITEVERSVRAAMADPAAATAVRSGLLVAPLHADGLAAADVSGSMAAPELLGSVPEAVVPPAEPAEPAGPSLAEQAKAARDRKLERARAAAQEAVARAADGLACATTTRSEAAADLAGRRSQAADLAAKLAELQQQIRSVERDLSQAEHDRTVAEKTLEKAGRAVELAEQADTVARQRLDSL